MKHSTTGIFWVKSQAIYVLFINGRMIARSNDRKVLRERAELLGLKFQ